MIYLISFDFPAHAVDPTNQSGNEQIIDDLSLGICVVSVVNPINFVGNIRVCVSDANFIKESSSILCPSLQPHVGVQNKNLYSAVVKIDQEGLTLEDDKVHIIVQLRYRKTADILETVTVNDETDGGVEPGAKKSRLLEDLHDLFVVKYRRELILKLDDGQCLRASVNKLAEKSKFFLKLLEGNKLKSSISTMPIKNVEFDIMNELLRFGHYGEVKNLAEINFKLLKAAKKFGMKELKDLCMISISKNLHSGTCLETLTFADDNKIDELFDECCNLIRV